MIPKKKLIKAVLAIFLFIFITIFIFYLDKKPHLIKLYFEKILPDRIIAVGKVLLREKYRNYLENNYNTLFLPKLQFNTVYYKKIKLNLDQNINNFFDDNPKTFYIETYRDNIFIFYKNSIYASLISDIKNNKFYKIKTNLPNLPLGIYIIKDEIYASIVTSQNNCEYLTIIKSKLNFKEINFKTIKKFDECSKGIRSGKIQSIEINNKLYLLVTTAADLRANTDYYDIKPQKDDSIFGKILLLDELTGEYNIYSKGHRNILGLYADKNIVLASENGPKGGDEINKILLGRNYGWPVSSYGDHYNPKGDSLNYKNNHEDYNFEEPIFSFVPSIAPTEVIRLDNNFSEKWQDSFLMGSLNSKHLFRIKFNKKFEKVMFYEKIFIGERIRDLKYNKKNKLIFLALESSGSLGILSTKKF